MYTSTHLDFMDEYMEEVREVGDGMEYAYGDE